MRAGNIGATDGREGPRCSGIGSAARISWNTQQTRYTHGRIRFVAGNALECELHEQFDLVFANQIIEHLVYPERLIERLKGLLKEGGKLVVTTPNWHYVRNNLPSFREIGDPAQFEASSIYC